ncbi:MAG: hypothetical protein V7637_1957 [Mycobacteriales bacterium]
MPSAADVLGGRADPAEVAPVAAHVRVIGAVAVGGVVPDPDGGEDAFPFVPGQVLRTDGTDPLSPTNPSRRPRPPPHPQRCQQVRARPGAATSSGPTSPPPRPANRPLPAGPGPSPGAEDTRAGCAPTPPTPHLRQEPPEYRQGRILDLHQLPATDIHPRRISDYSLNGMEVHRRYSRFGPPSNCQSRDLESSSVNTAGNEVGQLARGAGIGVGRPGWGLGLSCVGIRSGWPVWRQLAANSAGGSICLDEFGESRRASSNGGSYGVGR